MVFRLMQLYGLHMKRDTRVQEHLSHADVLSDHLAEVVIDVHKGAVSQSVKDGYSTLVTTFLAQEDNEPTLVFVKQALLYEE